MFKEIAEIATKAIEVPDLKDQKLSVPEAQDRPEWGQSAEKIPDIGDQRKASSDLSDGPKQIQIPNSFEPDNIVMTEELVCDIKNNDIKRIPTNNGHWDGEPGNSKWYPDPDVIPQNRQTNPDNKSWETILKENNIDGITFKEGLPDFSEISEGTVKIEDFSDNRTNNFAQADRKLAEKWNKEGKEGGPWTQEKVEAYRKENNLTWHERSDMETMDLVPSEVHGNIPHQGGIAAYKKESSEVSNA
jgi:hypothetical protein